MSFTQPDIDMSGEDSEYTETLRRVTRSMGGGSYSNRVTRSMRRSFPVLLTAKFTGLRVGSGVPGICGPDSLGLTMPPHIGAQVIFLAVRAYVRSHAPPPHIDAEDWLHMRNEPITTWKTDIDFMWVAALVFAVDIYVWSSEQGMKVFSATGTRPTIMDSATVTSTDWAQVVAGGGKLLAFNVNHFFALLLPRKSGRN